MSYLDWFKEFCRKNPAVVIGGCAGGLLGLSFSAFGFWRTLVVLVCAAVGLYLGLRVDGGDDVFSWPDRIKAFFKRK